jgi:hypothetical protein
MGVKHIRVPSDGRRQREERRMTPEDVVQQQVDAFNAHDVEQFVGCYSADAVIEDGDGRILYEGSNAIRRGYARRFAQNPQLHGEIHTRIQVGAWVIDEEYLTGENVKGLPPSVHKVAIYRVEGGKIVSTQLLT